VAVLGATAAAVVLTGLVGHRVVSAETLADPAPCVDTTLWASWEEQRLDRGVADGADPVGPELIRRAGFAPRVDEFAHALCEASDAAAATATVDRLGRSLWEAAVARAQGADPGGDAVPAGDDRPLYWARLAMARALRQWVPDFSASDADRAGWHRAFEYASRGLTTGDFGAADGTRKLFVSGFDPFQLNDEIRRGNPSGAAVLRLDGRTLTVDGERVQVQAVVLPVRYQDFEDGIVEDAFRPHVADGPQRADLLSTISQGGDAFDLEVWNGRRRSTTAADNDETPGSGLYGRPVTIPGVGPGPEFLRSSLPLEAMSAAGEGERFAVRINHRIVEIPAGATAPVETYDGPTPGSRAVEGGGGGYLSNESAYRVTRLVHEADSGQPAGHLHTPVLDFDPGNATEVTDPVFEANRTAIAAQVEKILLAGIAALD
jgi:hypothetical protein